MKTRIVVFLIVGLFLGFSGAAHADLTVIGTASYQGSTFNLIYDNNGPNGPITWLDYSSPGNTWQNHVNWASGLGSNLTVALSPCYMSTIDWTTDWRLPTTVDGPYVFGYNGTTTAGYNITTSEMGHLYYTALGNKGYYDTNGNGPQPGWVSPPHSGPFQNL